MNIHDTMKAMSDHQLLGMVEVMFEGDHSPADQPEVYVAAYDEAMTRPAVKAVIELCNMAKD